MERDDAGMVHAVDRGPGNALFRLLLGDLRVELALHAGDRDIPVRERVGLLRDLIHAVHELRERLELSPLVVGGRDRDVDVDGLGDVTHVSFMPPLVWRTRI